MQKQHKKAEVTPEAQVGIFWVVDGVPIVDGTPLDKAEECVGFKDHRRSHYEYWNELQSRRLVPAFMEYEECPRGRVIFNSSTRSFTFYADKCILNDKKMVAAIMKELQLPAKATMTDIDPHYRCARCLGRGRRVDI
jgi:hypothetical protein